MAIFVILGGDGNDDISGGDGHDFLVGGEGADKIQGDNGNDILVAMEIDCGLDLATLRDISLAWDSLHSGDEGETIADLLDRIDDPTLVDTLRGNQGADLFLINAGDDVKDFKVNNNKDGDVLIVD